MRKKTLFVNKGRNQYMIGDIIFCVKCDKILHIFNSSLKSISIEESESILLKKRRKSKLNNLQKDLK